MNLLAQIAKLARKHKLNLRVDILNSLFNDKLTTLGTAKDALKSLKKQWQLVATNKSDALKHTDVRHRADNIIFRKTQVKFAVGSYGKLLNSPIWLKTLIPKFHILLTVQVEIGTRQCRSRSPKFLQIHLLYASVRTPPHLSSAQVFPA